MKEGQKKPSGTEKRKMTYRLSGTWFGSLLPQHTR